MAKTALHTELENTDLLDFLKIRADSCLERAETAPSSIVRSLKLEAEELLCLWTNLSHRHSQKASNVIHFRLKRAA